MPLATETFEFKANPGQINIDEAQGIVECFVAAIGNKDSVGDIIIPGAFDASLKRRNPRVVWGHDWNSPIGKVLEIYEVRPGDSRLPMKMQQAGVGGLFARVQFNLKSERGRQAFSDIVFFGGDQEWCVDTETEILTDRGWLKFDEVTTDDRAYVLDPELGWGKFEQIKAVNIWEAKERQMRLIETGNHSSLTTGAHRWPLASNTNGGNVFWTTTNELKVHDRIIRSAVRSDAPVVQKYTDSFVELVGWFWTEGWVAPADHTDAGLYLAQSTKVNPQHVSSIRAALQSEFPGQWSEKHSSDDMARFRLTREGSEAIRSVTGEDKEPTSDFLTNLTRSQLLLLIQTCMNGDGHASKSGQSTWYQVSEKGIRAFEMLCALAGQPTNTMAQKDYGNRFGEPPTRVSLLKTGVAKPLDAIRVKSYKYKKGEPRTPATDEWVTTQGQIWCPTTPSGTWLARRNGTVYFTGNSIGYKTLDSVYDSQRAANILKEVELYEVSPVLHGANQLTATISIKSEKPEEKVTSFRKSKWPMFDREFAEMIRTEYPELWRKGGNIKGNAQYEILSKIANNGGTATTDSQIAALELREAWVARHEANFLLAGVIAQIKWLAIGSRGEKYMKDLIRGEIDKIEERKKKGLDLGYDQERPNDPLASSGPQRAEALAKELSKKFDGKIRINVMDENIVVFEVMRPGQPEETMRASYHYEEDEREFMIGEPERVVRQTVYTPVAGRIAQSFDSWPNEEQKAPTPIDAIPQENITGDVLRGYGPRRGNLERLLRYWRPIMRKPGGFRRCLVILADHPELYPLQNICAWLHHETTGLWPNEGCHHPGMKNCRKKIRGVVRGSLWSDDQFDARLARIAKPKKSDLIEDMEYDDEYQVTDTDVKFANMVLKEFMDDEPEFIQFLGDESNWIHVGDDDDDNEIEHEWAKPTSVGDCGCGCGGMKSDDIESILVKAGRVISSRNMTRLRQISDLIEQVIREASKEENSVKSDGIFVEAPITEIFSLRQHLDPIIGYHKIDCKATETGLEFDPQTVSVDAELALTNALKSFSASYGKKSVNQHQYKIIRNK
jgi:hypothetical protein